MYCLYVYLCGINVMWVREIREYLLVSHYPNIPPTLTLIAITGGSFNPAAGIALPAFKGEHMEDIWVYVVGPLLGAPIAACLFSFWILGEDATVNDREDCDGGGVISMRTSALHEDKNTDNVL